jgi:hypothetical protein
MASDVLTNKVAIIERCLARIQSEYLGHEQELETNYTRQDSILLNLQRLRSRHRCGDAPGAGQEAGRSPGIAGRLSTFGRCRSH